MNRFFSPLPIWQTAGLTAIRLTIGFFMIYHGWEIFDRKLMTGYLDREIFKNSWGEILVYTGKGSELVAGIFIFFGLFTRLGAVIPAVTFSYISFFVGKGEIGYGDQHPFLFVLLALVFLFMGGGKWSIDHLVFKNN